MTTKTTTLAATGTLALGALGGYLLKPHLPGDADGNGVVNFDDITSVNTNWNTTADGTSNPFAGAELFTAYGWSVDGPNFCLLKVPGEWEDWQARTGARYRGGNWVIGRPAEIIHTEDLEATP